MRDETGDEARGHAERRRLAAMHPLDDAPSPERRRAGAEVRGHEARAPRAARTPSALPALKPNQPNHRMPAPVSVIVQVVRDGPLVRIARRACPSRARTPAPRRPPSRCTTVPPAKSSAPILKSQPPSAHTQCATGS